MTDVRGKTEGDEVLFRTSVQRDADYLYFLKADGVWRIRRKAPGIVDENAECVLTIAIELDYKTHLYFLDADGNVARTPRTLRQAISPSPSPTGTTKDDEAKR